MLNINLLPEVQGQNSLEYRNAEEQIRTLECYIRIRQSRISGLDAEIDNIASSLGHLSGKLESYLEDKRNVRRELTPAERALSYVPIYGGVFLQRKSQDCIEDCMRRIEATKKKIPDMAHSVREELKHVNEQAELLGEYQTDYQDLQQRVNINQRILQNLRRDLWYRLQRLAVMPDFYNPWRLKARYQKPSSGFLKRAIGYGSMFGLIAFLSFSNTAKERISQFAEQLKPKTFYEYRLLNDGEEVDLNKVYVPISVRKLDVGVGEHALAVDKSQQKMYVYQYKKDGWDFVKSYDTSTGINPGPKSRAGDNKTPSETNYITNIENSSSWLYEGEIGYGPYFMRFAKGTYNSGGRFNPKTRNPIGIHGIKDYNKANGNEEALIGTPRSHGCIRLDNKDLRDLMQYVGIGTPVVMRESFYNGNLDDLNEIEANILAKRAGG